MDANTETHRCQGIYPRITLKNVADSEFKSKLVNLKISVYTYIIRAANYSELRHFLHENPALGHENTTDMYFMGHKRKNCMI